MFFYVSEVIHSKQNSQGKDLVLNVLTNDDDEEEVDDVNARDEEDEEDEEQNEEMGRNEAPDKSPVFRCYTNSKFDFFN